MFGQFNQNFQKIKTISLKLQLLAETTKILNFFYNKNIFKSHGKFFSANKNSKKWLQQNKNLIVLVMSANNLSAQNFN